MSRHSRQQKRRARLGRERVYASIDSTLADVARRRLENTGSFPRWASAEMREAILRGAL